MKTKRETSEPKKKARRRTRIRTKKRRKPSLLRKEENQIGFAPKLRSPRGRKTPISEQRRLAALSSATRPTKGPEVGRTRLNRLFGTRGRLQHDHASENWIFFFGWFVESSLLCYVQQK